MTSAPAGSEFVVTPKKFSAGFAGVLVGVAVLALVLQPQDAVARWAAASAVPVASVHALGVARGWIELRRAGTPPKIGWRWCALFLPYSFALTVWVQVTAS